MHKDIENVCNISAKLNINENNRSATQNHLKKYLGTPKR